MHNKRQMHTCDLCPKGLLRLQIVRVTDVKVQRATQPDLPAQDLPPANPYIVPNSYFKGCENVMGYILEEHFVTLSMRWR